MIIKFMMVVRLEIPTAMLISFTTLSTLSWSSWSYTFHSQSTKCFVEDGNSSGKLPFEKSLMTLRLNPSFEMKQKSFGTLTGDLNHWLGNIGTAHLVSGQSTRVILVGFRLSFTEPA